MIKLRAISLGAGVQSTTMALMAAHGELGPMPDCAIFADTGWEPKAVYEHLKWLTGVLPFPVHVVSAGNIREHLKNSSRVKQQPHHKHQRFATAPWFIKAADGSQGMGRRQCTMEFKIEPLRKKQRELLGYAPRKRIPPNSIEVWIGISLDEVMRVKPAAERWQVNRWPLIEKRMHRYDCLRWLDRNGYPLPAKSACIGCPFHSDLHWREMRDNSPDEFADAVIIDQAIRQAFKMRGEQYMHRSMVPLDQVDLSNADERGQPDLFNNECEGMCGV